MQIYEEILSLTSVYLGLWSAQHGNATWAESKPRQEETTAFNLKKDCIVSEYMTIYTQTHRAVNPICTKYVALYANV